MKRTLKLGIITLTIFMFSLTSNVFAAPPPSLMDQIRTELTIVQNIILDAITGLSNQLLGIDEKIDTLELNGPDLTNLENDLEALLIETQALNTRIIQLEQIINTEEPVADPNGPYTGGLYPIIFHGEGSYDVDGEIVSYLWDFGDGNTGTGVTPSHSYESSDTYTVKLTVTDEVGAQDTAVTSAWVYIGTLPVADAGGPYVVGPDDYSITFDGSGSTGPIVSYDWEISSFYAIDHLSGVTPSYTFERQAYVADVILTVADDYGNTHTSSTTVEVSWIP